MKKRLTPNRTALRIAWPFLAALGLYVLAQLLYNTSGLISLWNYPYDWNPGDGDAISLVHRLGQGHAIYGDSSKGEFFSFVPPLYYSFVALLDRVCGFNGAHGRQLNFFFIGTTILLIWRMTYRRLEGSGAFVFSLVGPVLFLIPLRLLWSAGAIAPDACVLFLTALTYTVLSEGSEKNKFSFMVAVVLAVSAALTKQSGVAVGAGCAYYYFAVDQKWGLRYVFAYCIVAAVGVAFFQRFGGFVIDTVFEAGASLVAGQPSWVDTVSTVARFYLWTGLPALILGSLAAYSPRGQRKRRDPVVTGWLVAGLFMFFKTVDNPLPQVWPHWMLTCVLATSTIREMAENILKGRSSAKLAVAGVMALFFVVASQGMERIPAPSFRDQVENEKIASQLKLLEATDPKDFLFDQYTAPLTSAGYESNVDAFTLYREYQASPFKVNGVVEHINNKDYALITTSSLFNAIPPIMEAIQQSYIPSPYWTKILNSDSVPRVAWEPKPVAGRNEGRAARGVCGEDCESPTAH